MKTLLFFVLMLLGVSCFSQQKIDFKNLDQLSKLEYSHDYTRYCLKKYHDRRNTGYTFQIAGLIVAGAGFAVKPKEIVEIYEGANYVYSYDYTLRYATSICGGAAIIIGSIIQVDADKWLKRAYIGPNGIGVKFQF